MTWIEALKKGRDRWVMWIALGSFLGCCFLVKGGTDSEFLWAVVIGAANGAAVGFAVGPAAEKGSIILSGLLAGTPLYFIGSSIFVLSMIDTREQTRDLPSDVILLVSIFLVVGAMISVAQVLRLRNRQTSRSEAPP
jgi:hypothetical protein